MDRKNDQYQIENNYLKDKEIEILNKARSVGQELESLRNQKIDLLCQMFKEQLLKDLDSDLNDYNQKLNVQYLEQNKELESEKDRKVQEFDTLIRNIQDQVQTFQMIMEDLVDKREELKSSQEAALEYQKKEKQRNLEDYRGKCEKVVMIKTKEFRNQIQQGKVL